MRKFRFKNKFHITKSDSDEVHNCPQNRLERETSDTYQQKLNQEIPPVPPPWESRHTKAVPLTLNSGDEKKQL